VGVVSGLPLEFQFGTNWSRFSTAIHGFFGNILGFEGAMAFMLEAGFLGIMAFGWNRVSPRMHLFSTCMVALGASLSAFWIMVANSWMQTPAGGSWVNGRYVMQNYWQGIFNPDLPWGFSHMWVACLETTVLPVGARFIEPLKGAMNCAATDWGRVGERGQRSANPVARASSPWDLSFFK